MPICNKEDDNAARMGKVLVGISGFGIFMALIGIVVAFVTLAGWSAPEGDYSGCTDALKTKFGKDPCESVNCDSAGGSGGSVDPWGPSGGSGSGSDSGSDSGSGGGGSGGGSGSGGGGDDPKVLRQSENYVVVTDAASCEEYPGGHYRGIHTPMECQIALDEMNTAFTKEASEEPVELPSLSDPSRYNKPNGCYEYFHMSSGANPESAAFNSDGTSSVSCGSMSYPCICAKNSEVPTGYQKIQYRYSDHYQMIASRAPAGTCHDFGLFEIMDPNTCKAALTAFDLKVDTWPAMLRRKHGQSAGCYYDLFMDGLHIESHEAANGTGTCQIGSPCICADSLADANITGRGDQERRLRNGVTDAVALRAWADRHLSASSGNDDNDGVCGSSVDGKGCCSTICGGSEYISKAACTSSSSGSNTGTETCTCTNKQAADDSYCSGYNSKHPTIACRVDETAAGRGGTTPICGICSEEQGACTISYDQTSGESCTCFDKKGSSVVTSDTGCKALWTGIYADSMCCGGMPPDVKTELVIVPTIRGLCIAALVSVIIGMLPIFLGGIGKIYGLEVFAMVSGTCGVIMQWCCGVLLAIIFIVIPFFIGVGLMGACETSKAAGVDNIDMCLGMPKCSGAFSGQVESLCAIGHGASVASGFVIFCVLLSVITSLLTLVGFCIPKSAKQEASGAEMYTPLGN